jgi:hypothetical protein
MAGVIARRELTLTQQALALQRAQPESVCRFNGHSTLIWLGTLQPTSLSEGYRIKIRYKTGCFPETTVVTPALRQRDGQPIPHMYHQKRLCLFHPEKCEWNGTMSIAESILPWASLWLYYYELWHATGEWLGGGEHPKT